MTIVKRLRRDPNATFRAWEPDARFVYRLRRTAQRPSTTDAADTSRATDGRPYDRLPSAYRHSTKSHAKKRAVSLKKVPLWVVYYYSSRSPGNEGPGMESAIG